MTIYADVLIILNLYVSFFLLQLTFRLCGEALRPLRCLLASLLGGVAALYILLPPMGAAVDCAFRLLLSSAIMLVAAPFGNVRAFIKRVALFFAASFIYAGIMLGLLALIQPGGMAVLGGFVYMELSPALLIICTLVCYGVITLIRFFVRRQAKGGERCRLLLEANGQRQELTALVDTGHSLTDALSGRGVVIVDPRIVRALLGFIPSPTEGDTPLPRGFRPVPYSTVGGRGLLAAFTPDRLLVLEGRGSARALSALVAAAEEPFLEDYDAIISPEYLSCIK